MRDWLHHSPLSNNNNTFFTYTFPNTFLSLSPLTEFTNVLQHFSNSAFVKSRCAQVGIGEGLFKAAAPAFCRMLKQDYMAKSGGGSVKSGVKSGGGKVWSLKRSSSLFHTKDDLDGARIDESLSVRMDESLSAKNEDSSPSDTAASSSTPSLVDDIISSSSRSRKLKCYLITHHHYLFIFTAPCLRSM